MPTTKFAHKHTLTETRQHMEKEPEWSSGVLYVLLHRTVWRTSFWFSHFSLFSWHIGRSSSRSRSKSRSRSCHGPSSLALSSPRSPANESGRHLTNCLPCLRLFFAPPFRPFRAVLSCFRCHCGMERTSEAFPVGFLFVCVCAHLCVCFFPQFDFHFCFATNTFSHGYCCFCWQDGGQDKPPSSWWRCCLRLTCLLYLWLQLRLRLAVKGIHREK